MGKLIEHQGFKVRVQVISDERHTGETLESLVVARTRDSWTITETQTGFVATNDMQPGIIEHALLGNVLKQIGALIVDEYFTE